MDNKKLVFDVVQSSTCHPTADDIYQTLRTKGNKLTLATVYNNLNALCEEGKIRRLSFEEKSIRYDKLIRHDHMVCTRCGKISNVAIENLAPLIEKQCGIRLEGYDLKLYHTCDECAAN